MTTPIRQLVPGQVCEVWVHDCDSGENSLLFRTKDILLEAPNWTLDGKNLILNGDGKLWRISVTDPILLEIPLVGMPPLNNDHVLDPDGLHIFMSACDDWQIYRAALSGGDATLISGREGPDGLLHFLHGVSPDGKELAFVGVRATISDLEFTFHSTEICTIEADGSRFRQITNGGVPADGPEYAPDGKWIYFNTEVFSGHAQIARMNLDGSVVERLTHSPTVDWFPHIAPDGSRAVYLSYPSGTRGHPADLWVELKVVGQDWSSPRTAIRLFGGQGTINVNSWSPDSRRFAFVAYPLDRSG